MLFLACFYNIYIIKYKPCNKYRGKLVARKKCKI